MKIDKFLVLNPFVITILICLTGLCNATAQISASYLVIKNINIIDVLSGKLSPNQDVIIKDKMIYSIDRSLSKTFPQKAIYIDGSGKYLLPGLWDMHFHLCWQENNDTLLFPILLQNGITGIRDMGGDLNIMRNFKERLKNSKMVGPDIYGPGPIIDGNPPVHRDFSLPVDDKTNLKSVLDSLRTNGADFFKVYSLIKEPQLKDIAAYCSANHISFAGHFSEYIEPEVSISLGQKTVEHLNRLDNIWEGNKNRMDSIGHLLIANDVFLCPTLITYQLKTRLRDTSITKIKYAKYISASLMEEWKINWAGRIKRQTKYSDWENLDKTYISQMALIDHLNKMGVMLLAGSDFAGMPYVYPGIGLQEELFLLVQAGLSTQQALRTATINPAIYMSVQQLYGSISIGKYADLIILEKNPLEDIKNIQAINSVIFKGKVVHSSPVEVHK